MSAAPSPARSRRSRRREAAQPAASESLAEYLMDCERSDLSVILERHGGHMTHAAEALGIARKTLWEKLRRLGIKAKGEP